ncbi:hypothetical protein CEV31_3579 [Brucella thiophenivorans]|uniref:Uncharacterized protein n=1 Tax=Brucella thiophenivorans TaxID=571255 RepID=A0A256FCK6_9HYPH|nr:hypothetical protein CEV31_3579 [Brucella thiophenivorans]
MKDCRQPTFPDCLGNIINSPFRGSDLPIDAIRHGLGLSGPFIVFME